MRIIRQGQLPELQMFKGTCSNCKTVFECQRKEGRYESDFRDGGGFLRVSCPTCGKSAIAYPRNDGQSIPGYDRDRYTWSGLASQMADGPGWPGDH